MMRINARAWAAIPALGLAVSLALAGCAGGQATSSSSNGVDAATATSAQALGGIEGLTKAANAEGKLNVIALPRDWANYGAVIDGFKKKYPKIQVTEQAPDDSSAQEIQAAKTNKGLSNAPDVFDLGLQVAEANKSIFAAYKVEKWADIPDNLKDSTGLYTGDYGGYMSIGYDSSKYPAPTDLNSLLSSKYKGAVAMNGDPTQAGAAFAAVGLATLNNGGTLDNYQAGIDFFKKLNKAGNFLKLDVTSSTVASGSTPVVFDWDYLNAAHVKDKPAWKTVILPGTGYAGYYNQAINKDAPHPAAARLWEEYLYSDEAQNLFLTGGARPVRADAMKKSGTLDESAWNKLPQAPAEAVQPTKAQADKAATLLSSAWSSVIN